MPGLTGSPYRPSTSTFGSVQQDPLFDSFLDRIQRIEKADQEKSDLLHVSRLFGHGFADVPQEVIQQYACLSHQLGSQGQPKYHDDLVKFHNAAVSSKSALQRL
jgi:hypothetical protein